MIVFDTHAWIWYAAKSEKLSKAGARAAEKAKIVIVSAISVWEVAMLVSKGRLGLDRDVDIWVKQALSLAKIRLEPLTPSISIRSTRLPGDFHGDPPDCCDPCDDCANWTGRGCATGGCVAGGCATGGYAGGHSGNRVAGDGGLHQAPRIISQTEHTITVDLGVGKASAFCYSCDLSAEYVRINADYHT